MSSGNSCSGSKNSNDGLMDAIATIKFQTTRLAKYQHSSYAWNLQHHNNIKNIIRSVNEIARVLQDTTGAEIAMIEIEEDSALFKPERSHGTDLGKVEEERSAPEPKETFDQFVLKNAQNLRSQTFLEAFLALNGQQFEELTERSVEALLPVVLEMTEQGNQCLFTATFLGAVLEKFAPLFKKKSNRRVMRKLIEALDNINHTEYEKNTSLHAEVRRCKSMLMSALLNEDEE